MRPGIGFSNAPAATPPSIPLTYGAPTSAISQNSPRNGILNTVTLAAITDGVLTLTAIYLPINKTITSITFVSGTTAGNTMANQIFGLFDSARVRVGITADDTSTAWGANATKTLTLAAPYLTTYSGLYYVGIAVKATIAVPTLMGMTTTATGLVNLAPILNGTSDGTLTNAASWPTTATAITATALVPYCYVS